MEQKKKLIIGGAIAVAVVIALIWILHKPDVLVADEPKFYLKDLHNMAPEDGSVLVAFQGFAKYLSDKYANKRYLPLAPVTGIQVSSRQAFKVVRFDSAHGFVSLGITTEVDKNFTSFHIKDITIETNDGDPEKSCHVDDAAILYDDGAHYECLKPLPPFSCVRNIKDEDEEWVELKVAELTIRAIRVEINGDASRHKEGKFTYDFQKCVVK